jgi:uncharacterized protein YndB with AHSA1/START domain
MTDAASRFVYVTYIRTTPEQLWSALTTTDVIARFWFGMTLRTDWTRGAAWQLVFQDGRIADGGEILEFDPPKRLVLAWRNEWNPEFKAEGVGTCTIELEPAEGAVKLTVHHAMQPAESRFIGAVAGGWPKILSNLKSLLETGEVALKG